MYTIQLTPQQAQVLCNYLNWMVSETYEMIHEYGDLEGHKKDVEEAHKDLHLISWLILELGGSVVNPS